MTRHRPVFAAFAALLFAVSSLVAQERPRKIVVASKPFGESYLLAEMFAQLLEARGVVAERRLGLGATEIAFAALRSGDIDVYPEYTGTGLLAILHERPSADPRAAFAQVAREFRERFGMRWLPPLGFQNTYAIAVRRETSARLHLRTLSDLARAGPDLRAGLTPDFIGRADGLPGLQGAYDLRFREVRALLPAVKYQALAAGEVDVIDGYATDGLIARYDLVVLEDDRAFFPPYEAAALLAPGVAERAPAAVAALTELSGLLDEQRMRGYNRRIEVDGEPVARVAAAALDELRLLGREDRRTGTRGGPVRGSLAAYLWGERRMLLHLVARHLLLVAVSLVAAVGVAVPLGLALERTRRAAEAVIRGVGVLQTVPGIALLAFMIPVLGIGLVPALVALFLYSLYPILRNTYAGVRSAAPDAVGAARALGMTPQQVLRHVRLPLAAPLIMAGIRTAAVINVGTATLAAFIGAGGLGDPIAAGLALSDTRMILSGALPAAVLALGVDAVLGACERAVRPGGVAP
ncbi:MAG TPA: glycine betaine ABC transporter substrate-binding protein [Gemmatimonadales bacterium]|nr:glycine betaine ABC transporter substrate-binding protein [Gemmatimonadales bacterium]